MNLESAKAVSGLSHYYDFKTDAKDKVGNLHGVPTNVAFDNGAVFNGTSFIEMPESRDFSATKTGGLTIAFYLTISDWKGQGAKEYIHYFGKGTANKHEYTGRHYVDGGVGEAPSRQGRLSFYAFNANGGLGAGSYYQDSTEPKTERFVVMTLDKTNVSLHVGGVKRDTDPLSGYNIVQTYTTAPLRFGTRDMVTGFLKGKIRDVAIYNRVVSDAEALALFENTPDPIPSDWEGYVVKSTDTYASLATTHNTTAAIIRKANGGIGLDPGAIIWVPAS